MGDFRGRGHRDRLLVEVPEMELGPVGVKAPDHEKNRSRVLRSGRGRERSATRSWCRRSRFPTQGRVVCERACQCGEEEAD